MNSQCPILQTFDYNSTLVSLLLYDKPCEQYSETSYLALDVQAKVPSGGIIDNETEKLQQRLRDLQTAREAVDRACSEVESLIERAIQGDTPQPSGPSQTHGQGAQPTRAYPAFSPISSPSPSTSPETMPWDDNPEEFVDQPGPTCSSVCSSKRRRNAAPQSPRRPFSQAKWATSPMTPSFAAGSRTHGAPPSTSQQQQQRQQQQQQQQQRRRQASGARTPGGVSATHSDMSTSTTQSCRPQGTSAFPCIRGTPPKPPRNVAGTPARKAPRTAPGRQGLASSSTTSLTHPANRTIQDLVGKFNNLEDIAFDEVSSHGHQKEALNLSMNALNDVSG